MHTNHDKAVAIRNLIVNLGDVKKTADEVGISERTLRNWKKDILNEDHLIYWDEEKPPFQIYQRYERIRVQMLIETERLLLRMKNVHAIDAVEIANSVSRLTDRLARIEEIMERLGQYVIRIDINALDNLIFGLKQQQQEQPQAVSDTPPESPENN